MAPMLFLAGGVGLTQATASRTFVDALSADGPVAQHADKMTLYVALLGDWEVDVIDYDPDGTRHTSKGEWHFAWVLEGRAIQDVWIAPPRTSRRPGQPTQNNRYGTSLLVYDPAAGVWQVTWINPVSGAFNRLVGRSEGDQIVQEGKNPDESLIRWIFSDITPQSFRWRGEVSVDQGKTWRLAAEFFGHRPRVARPR
jgi:hypothetical protein